MSFAPVSQRHPAPRKKQAAPDRQPQRPLDPQWVARHPVSAGVVKVEDYRPPGGSYRKPEGADW